MPAFSIDLRRRIIAAIDAEQGTRQQVADRARVSASFARKLLNRRRDAGPIDPMPRGSGRPPLLVADALARPRTAVAEHPDATLAGARVRFLPPYNPIGAMSSKPGASPREAKARTRGASGAWLRTVFAGDIRGWSAHCGYRVAPADGK